MGSGSSSRSKKSLKSPESVDTLDVSYSKKIHNLRKRYDGENQQWIRDRLDTLITKVARETNRSQNVQVTVYINNDAHIIGEGKANKISMVLREKLKNTDHDGIDCEWTFKTEGKYLVDMTKEALQKIQDAVKYLWDDIVQILQGVRQDAVAAAGGGGKLAITSA